MTAIQIHGFAILYRNELRVGGQELFGVISPPQHSAWSQVSIQDPPTQQVLRTDADKVTRASGTKRSGLCIQPLIQWNPQGVVLKPMVVPNTVSGKSARSKLFS